MPADTPTPILRKRLSQAEQTMDRCVHFTGLQNDTCKAGVAYKSVRLDHDPITYRRERGPVYTQSRSFPCLASHNLGGAVCEKRCAPTPEQVGAEEAESNSYIEQTMTAPRMDAMTPASSPPSPAPLAPDHPLMGMLDEYRAAVFQNGRVRGADYVSAYHEFEDAHEAARRAALTAELAKYVADAERLREDVRQLGLAAHYAWRNGADNPSLRESTLLDIARRAARATEGHRAMTTPEDPPPGHTDLMIPPEAITTMDLPDTTPPREAIVATVIQPAARAEEGTER